MVKITVRYEDGLTNDIIIDDVMSVSNIINGILVRCKQNNISPPEFEFDDWENAGLKFCDSYI